MIRRNFREMLEKQWAGDKFVCVGLDSDFAKIPKAVKQGKVKETIFSFNRQIVDATADLVCAYKPNIAFYEGQGMEGISALIQTVSYIHKRAPRVPVILDAKRADIGNTNKGYVEAVFHTYGTDAVTVHPYLGREALKPFLDEGDKGIIVLCRTSNPGAGEFQDLKVNGKPLYQIVARRVAQHWNENNNCAVVVGATYPSELQKVRGLVEDMPILIPGIGTQGGDVKKTVKAGKDSRGWGMIINSSRGIIFASDGPDFATVARNKTIELSEMINQYR